MDLVVGHTTLFIYLLELISTYNVKFLRFFACFIKIFNNFGMNEDVNGFFIHFDT